MFLLTMHIYYLIEIRTILLTKQIIYSYTKFVAKYLQNITHLYQNIFIELFNLLLFASYESNYYSLMNLELF